ncbi:MAG: J domain-containing protein [Sphingomonadales bacterium]|nr:J domain-containing protein [Sphingomonadales bacterium]
MARLVVLLLLASLGCKTLTGHWPWVLLRRYILIAPASAPARARALLGVSTRATREDIIAAHRKLLFAVHPDRGGHEKLVHEADAARDLLLAVLPAAGHS